MTTLPYKYLSVTHVPPDSLVQLLEDTVYGTPGKGLLYQHCQVREKVKNISHPNYVSIVKNNRVIGTACFCKKESSIGRANLDLLYVRFFTFKDVFRTKQVNSKPKGNKEGLLKKEINNLLNGFEFTELKSKACFYAFLEAKNERSLNLCESFDFKPVRAFSTAVFSRFYPKKQTNVEPCKLSDKALIIKLLKDKYAAFNMVSFENLFFNNSYYVLKDAVGNIIAGAQANTEHWKIRDLPGLEGKIILSVFPHIPLVKTVFNPDYRFLSFEAIYVKKGHEKGLEILFEAILAEKNIKSAMMWFDSKSFLKDALDQIKMGMLNKFAKDKNGVIAVKCLNFDETELRLMETLPAYISAFDLT